MPQDINPGTWFTGIIDRFLTIVVWPIFLGVVVIMFIYAGFLFLTAQGEPGKVSEAKKALIWAVVGIIVAIFAFSSYGLVARIIGVPATTVEPCNGMCDPSQTCDTTSNTCI